MKSVIKEFLEPTNDEKQELWGECVFVFDTNVLLNLYRYSAKTRRSLLAAFESFKDRIWIPYQVAYEFMRKRCEVIFETVWNCQDLCSRNSPKIFSVTMASIGVFPRFCVNSKMVI